MSRKLTEAERADLEAAVPILKRMSSRASLNCRGRLTRDDLFGLAVDGYLAGILAHEPVRGPLRPYAIRRAFGAMLDAIRRAGHEVKIPSHVFDDHLASDAVDDADATPEPDTWAAIRLHARGLIGVHLHARMHEWVAIEGDEGSARVPREVVHAFRDAVLADLPERDRDLLLLKWDDGLGGAEIAERIGKSKAQANRMLAAAFARFHERAVELARARLGIEPPSGGTVVPFRPR